MSENMSPAMKKISDVFGQESSCEKTNSNHLTPKTGDDKPAKPEPVKQPLKLSGEKTNSNHPIPKTGDDKPAKPDTSSNSGGS